MGQPAGPVEPVASDLPVRDVPRPGRADDGGQVLRLRALLVGAVCAVGGVAVGCGPVDQPAPVGEPVAAATHVRTESLTWAWPPRPRPARRAYLDKPPKVRPVAPSPTPTPPVTGSGMVASPSGFSAWLSSATARFVWWRESRGSCTVVNSSGHGGKWQFDVTTWISNGGGRYASAAQYASCHEQDLVAYVTWQRRGWQPWGL